MGAAHNVPIGDTRILEGRTDLQRDALLANPHTRRRGTRRSARGCSRSRSWLDIARRPLRDRDEHRLGAPRGRQRASGDIVARRRPARDVGRSVRQLRGGASTGEHIAGDVARPTHPNLGVRRVRIFDSGGGAGEHIANDATEPVAHGYLPKRRRARGLPWWWRRRRVGHIKPAYLPHVVARCRWRAGGDFVKATIFGGGRHGRDGRPHGGVRRRGGTLGAGQARAHGRAAVVRGRARQRRR
jgi:hypothetical protein